MPDFWDKHEKLFFHDDIARLIYTKSELNNDFDVEDYYPVRIQDLLFEDYANNSDFNKAKDELYELFEKKLSQQREQV